jgi:hypothetical protein
MKKRVIAQVEGEDGNVQVLDLDINAAHELYKALYAYTEGVPVVVFAPNKAILHGTETLKGIVAANVCMSVCTVYGVEPQRFYDSDWSDLLESAQQIFMRGGTFGDSFKKFVQDGIARTQLRRGLTGDVGVN